MFDSRYPRETETSPSKELQFAVRTSSISGLLYFSQWTVGYASKYKRHPNNDNKPWRVKVPDLLPPYWPCYVFYLFKCCSILRLIHRRPTVSAAWVTAIDWATYTVSIHQSTNPSTHSWPLLAVELRSYTSAVQPRVGDKLWNVICVKYVRSWEHFTGEGSVLDNKPQRDKRERTIFSVQIWRTTSNLSKTYSIYSINRHN